MATQPPRRQFIEPSSYGLEVFVPLGAKDAKVDFLDRDVHRRVVLQTETPPMLRAWRRR